MARKVGGGVGVMENVVKSATDENLLHLPGGTSKEARNRHSPSAARPYVTEQEGSAVMRSRNESRRERIDD